LTSKLHDFEMVSAYGPEEGIEKRKPEHTVLVILDVLMPNAYEGFDVARMVREDLKMWDLPVLHLLAGNQKRSPLSLRSA
jgi:CheY-like chemotaxis protein